MKKIISVLLACAMLMALCVSLGGCDKTESSDPSADNKDNPSTSVGKDDKGLIETYGVKLINDGYLTVGTEASYEPFEDTAEDGSYIGYDIDLMKEIADLMGVELKIINTGFDGILDGIGVNYDCVASAVTILPERMDSVLFSSPYIQNYQAVVVKKGSDKKVSSFTDLNGSNVTLQKGTTSDNLMNELNDNGTISISIVANESITMSFASLKNGEVDYVVCDSTVADVYVATSPDDYEIIFVDETEPEEFAIAVGKQDTALQSAINDALKTLEDNGFMQENRDHWF